MARILDAAHQSSLGAGTSRTVLEITLGDASVLRLATADLEVDSVVYLGKLDPETAKLNMELSKGEDGIDLRIANIDLGLGQDLINTPNILDGTFARLGAYFKNGTGEEFIDWKICGELETKEIDGGWVPVYLRGETDAATYGGVTIASLFPDSEIPTIELPPGGNGDGGGTINDIENPGRRLPVDPWGNPFNEDARHVLPF